MSALVQVIAMMGKVVTPPTYATWNPSDKDADITLSSGNLVATLAASTAGSVRSTVGKASGKWYWELVQTGSNYRAAGVGNGSFDLTVGTALTTGAVVVRNDGTKYVDGSVSAYSTSYASGATLGVYLDMDAGTVGLLVNNVDMGIITTGLTGTYYAVATGASSAGNKVFTANFGATALTYSPPSGFNAGLYS